MTQRKRKVLVHKVYVGYFTGDVYSSALCNANWITGTVLWSEVTCPKCLKMRREGK